MNRPRPSLSAFAAALVTVAALALAVALAAGCAGKPNVDRIIARCITARGGLDSLRAVSSKRLTGRVVFAGRDSGAFMVEMKRGGKMRQEMNLTSGSVITTLDGTRGWAISSMRQQSEPDSLTAGQVRNMAGGADLDGPLVDWKSKGNLVELLGVEKVLGRDAWKLKVTQANGQMRLDYIDCVTHLEVKWVGLVDQRSQQVTFESYFNDYRKVGGTWHAFRIDSDSPGSSQLQTLIFDRIDVNVPIDDADFGRPALAANGAAPAHATHHARASAHQR
ncbi:MAG: hypothetical protein ACRENS_10320 [Candidatus Eiseniibacteriota bacterium]